MGDSFYRMDDDYIEKKYVQAEQDRQRKAEEERRIREAEEAEALVAAEKQRKAAEAERLKRKEETDRLNELENAKKSREEADRKRKEIEAKYQGDLDKIEEEVKSLESSKGKFITEKLELAKTLNNEEAVIKADLDKVLAEKRAIIEREEAMRGKLDDFGHRARREKIQLDQKETDTNNRLKELAHQKRDIQNEMLRFLQQPMETSPPPKKTPTFEQPSSHGMPYPNYSSSAPPMKSHQPPPQQSYNPPPGRSQETYKYGGATVEPEFKAPPQQQPSYGYPGYGQNQNPAPSYPQQTGGFQGYPGSNNSWQQPSAPAPIKDPLSEQLDMLEELLNTGVMTKEEYEANKKEALKAAGFGESSNSSAPPVTVDPKKAEVDRQISQLDDYLRQGILLQADYDDAKNRVYRDAGMTPPGATAGSNIPFAQIPPSTQGPVRVEVTCPPRYKPGMSLRITFQGREYTVAIPPGIKPGQKFQAIL